MTKLMKSDNLVKSSVNKRIGHIHETIVHINKGIQYEEMESKTKLLHALIKTNNHGVHMILRERKRLRAHPKRKKSTGWSCSYL